MIRYGIRALAAQLRRAGSLFLLTTLGVALGIASVLSIQIINRSALGAFRGGMRAVSGEADLSVVPRLSALADSLFAVVLADPAVVQAWPAYQVTAAVTGREHFYLDVVGVDFFAPVDIPLTSATADPSGAVTAPGWTAVSEALARELDLRIGDTLPVSSGTRRATLAVGAIVDLEKVAPLASRKLVVMDIAQAQSLLGTRGELTGIDARLVPGSDTGVVAPRLRAALGPAADVLTPQQRAQRAEGLLRAFRLNLTALSLISLVVGFFLVHTATQAALVRRRREFGVLRAAGATHRQVLGLILGEVAVLGLAGVAIGLPAGYLAARANIGVVSQTISNLYLMSEIERLDVPLWLWIGAGLVGLAGAVAGALGPALDLARAEVKELLAPISLHERTGMRAGRLFTLGLAVLGVAAAWYRTIGAPWQPSGFVLAIAVLLSIPLLTPLIVRGVAARLPLRGFGLAYSIRSLAVRLQTTSFAVSSLGIAVAMLVSITMMVGSFRDTVTVWVGQTLRADVYVTAMSWRGAGGQGTLDADIVRVMRQTPGVSYIDRLRGFQGYTGARRIGIAGVDFALPGGSTRFALLSGTPATAFRDVHDSGAVLITEPLSRKTGIGRGGLITLTTKAGERAFRVAGVTFDYSSENGSVAMDLRTLEAMFGPGPLNSIALYLEPGADPERVIDRIRSALPGAPLNLRSNRSLRAEVFRIFDQTFAVTRLLQVLALLVAAGGITLTLLILARERRSELAVYGVLGARRRQIFGFFVGKGAGIGLFGLGIGFTAGIVLAAILVFVINRAYFGWTIQFAWPWAQLGTGAATILLAAMIASLYPAARASRTPATQLSRDDL